MAVQGNGFIGAFVADVRVVVGLLMPVWFLFGTALVPVALATLSVPKLVGTAIAVVALTVQ